MPLQGAALYLNLGQVEASNGRAFCRVMFIVEQDDKGYVQLWSAERDESNSGVSVLLGQRGLNELRKILNEVDETIAGLKRDGKMNALAVR